MNEPNATSWSSRTPRRDDTVEAARARGRLRCAMRVRAPCSPPMTRDELAAVARAPAPDVDALGDDVSGRRHRARDRAGRRRHDPARGRARARRHGARCSASTWATSASSPRSSATTWMTRCAASSPATTRSRSASRCRCACKDADGRRRLRDVGAERGDGREGQPRTHARGRPRDRRPAAVELRLRRHGRLDSHRVDRVQLLCGRTGDLADASRRSPSCRCRRTRCSRSRSSSAPTPRSRSRCSSARTAPASCGATAAARTTSRPAPAWSCAAPRARCVWHDCIPPRSPTGSCASSSCPSRDGAVRDPDGVTARQDRAVTVIEEMRLRDLGVIAEATLPTRRRVHRDHRRDRRGQDHGRHRPRPAARPACRLGRGARRALRRPRSTACGSCRRHGAVADRVRGAGGDLEPLGDGQRRAATSVAHVSSAEGRSRASVGGRAAPGRRARRPSPTSSSSCTASRTSCACAPPSAQRDALDRFGGATGRDGACRLRGSRRALARARRARSRRSPTNRDAPCAPKPTRCARRSPRSRHGAPQPGEDAELAVRAERLANAEELRLAAAARPRGALERRRRAMTSGACSPRLGALLERALGPGAHRASPRRPPTSATASRTLAATLSGYLADLDESGPHELAAVEERRAALGALIRAHGSLDEAIALWRDRFRPAGRTRRRRRADRTADAGARCRGIRARRRMPQTLTAARTDAAARLGAAVTRRAARPRDARRARSRSPSPPGTESAHGRDDVAILLAPHPGAEPRPVAKGASGGELSRVMLAIEVVIAGDRPRADLRVRRGRCRHRRCRGDRGRAATRAAGPDRRRSSRSRTSPRSPRSRTTTCPSSKPTTDPSPPRVCGASKVPSARPRWPGCCRDCPIRMPRSPTRANFSAFGPRRTDRIKARDGNLHTADTQNDTTTSTSS